METETKKREGEQTIPREVILTHILPRLGSKDLAKFKGVCREWNATISSFDFARARMKMLGIVEQILLLKLHRPEIETKPGEFQGNEYSEIDCLSYNETGVKDVVNMNCPLQHVGQMGVHHHIIWSCNGLVCLYLVYPQVFGIWNPNTNQYRQVPISSEIVEDDGLALDAEGFGYLPETMDYYIFNMFSNREPAGDDLSLRFFLFTFSTGLWRELPIPDRAFQFADNFNRPTTGMFVQGRLYWPRRNSTTRLIQGLFFFDLATEQLNPVHLSPKFVDFRYNAIADVFEMNGNLSISCTKRNEIGHVWVFRKEENADNFSWVHLYNFDVAGLVFSFTRSGLYLEHVHGQLKMLQVTEDVDVAAEDGRRVHTYAGNIWDTRLHLPTFIPIRITNPN